MKTTTFRKTASMATAIALITGAGLFNPAAAAAPTRYITTTGNGVVSVIPDAVKVSATVSVLGTTSKAALATANTTSVAVRKALTANKIAARDIATQSISVYPEYSYPDNSTPVISGYRASQSFSITVRAATTAGAVVDAIVDAGGANVMINGASPFVLDNEKATDLARTAAVKSAKAKATSYAKLLGVKLGRVVFLNEQSSPNPFPVFGVTAKAEDSATQIDLGQQEVTVLVTVRWAI
ncbi:unannotated protein [freshwater metagenome]|uniref:Unannotated protein n=1 Tax=freshwater metagenome TaxID=449393 RepID=A0A6J6K9V7_9ZZZZ